MPTTINADTVVGGAIITGDTSGQLALQAAGSTKLTVAASGVTLAQPLPVGSGGTGSTSLSGITVGTATNLAGGSNGTIPYQSAAGTTQMLAAGTSGQVLTSNGAGAAPTWATPGGSTITATASGSIANGKPVVVNSDGTVSAVMASAISAALSTEFSFSSTTANVYGAVYDQANAKVVVSFVDQNDNYGKVVVGTVSGNTISFGSKITFNSAITSSPAIVYHAAAQAIVVLYRNGGNSNLATARVGYVSGSNVTFGSAVTGFDGAGVAGDGCSLAYDPVNQKVVAAIGFGSYGKAFVGTVSGSTISFGSGVQYSGTGNVYVNAVYDTANQKTVILFREESNGYANAIVGTVSGTSISFGSKVAFNSEPSLCITATYDSTNNKIVVSYKSDSTYLSYAVVGTVSGTDISFGSRVMVYTAQTYMPSGITFDSARNNIIILYSDGDSSGRAKYAIGEVSGTSISFSSVGTQVWGVATASNPVALYVPGVLKTLFFWGSGTTVAGLSKLLTLSTTNLTSTNFVGMSSGSYSNGQTATVQIVGAVNSGQTGLTPGTQCYVQPDGTLSQYAGSPEVPGGTAITSTSLIVKG